MIHNVEFMVKRSLSSQVAVLLVTVMGTWNTSPALLGQENAALESSKAPIEWLTRQITPNALVPEPAPQRRRMVLSYQPSPGEESSPLFQNSFVYDVALSAIAFSLTGHRENAALVLHALARQIRPDGSLWFAYNTKNTWPDEMSHDFAQVRGGAIAWCGYAFSLYLDIFPPKNTDPSGLVRERVQFLKAATHLAEYLLSLQIQDPTSQRHGLMLGGWGRVGLRFNSQLGEVVEVYFPGPVPFVSTENNISIYFFLTKLAKITGEDRYARVAESIAQSLVRALWDESGAQFWMGFQGSDEVNRGGALDCASWGALFWLARGDSSRARRSLETARRLYWNRDGPVEGHRPYYDWPIYEDRKVAEWFFPGTPGKQWKDLPIVWSEGSLGVALAYLRLEDKKQATEILEGLKPLIHKDGGLLYASRDVPYHFSRLPSVAGTAWWVFLQEALEDPDRLPNFLNH